VVGEVFDHVRPEVEEPLLRNDRFECLFEAVAVIGFTTFFDPFRVLVSDGSVAHRTIVHANAPI